MNDSLLGIIVYYLIFCEKRYKSLRAPFQQCNQFIDRTVDTVFSQKDHDFSGVSRDLVIKLVSVSAKNRNGYRSYS